VTIGAYQASAPSPQPRRAPVVPAPKPPVPAPKPSVPAPK
jgi:hypothetical protein